MHTWSTRDAKASISIFNCNEHYWQMRQHHNTINVECKHKWQTIGLSCASCPVNQNEININKLLPRSQQYDMLPANGNLMGHTLQMMQVHMPYMLGRHNGTFTYLQCFTHHYHCWAMGMGQIDGWITGGIIKYQTSLLLVYDIHQLV